MKYGKFFLVLIAAFAAKLPAQNGAITSEMLNEFKRVEINPAIVNAVTNNRISNLSVNNDLKGRIDPYFSVQVDVKGITDQKSTGRCWLFTSLNVLRPAVMEKFGCESFEFSENYSFFYDQLEKANLFLEGIIETRDMDLKDKKVEWLFRHSVGDGGVWNMAVALFEKYGVVPKSAMEETHQSESTGAVRSLLRKRLKKSALKIRKMAAAGAGMAELRDEKMNALTDVYTVLVASFGKPPEKFVWRYKKSDGTVTEAKEYTPLEFYNEAVEKDLHDYIMLMNDPSREYFKLYEIQYDRNMVNAENWTYINLPAENLKEYAKKSLSGGEPMYFSCDVGKQLDREDGILSVDNYKYSTLFGVDFSMTKEERIQSFESASTHGMALVGVDTTEDGSTRKWLLENSWGPSAGHNGFLIMTDEWFDEYMFRLVVPDTYIPKDILHILDTKPVLLDPWDPMYAPIFDR